MTLFVSVAILLGLLAIGVFAVLFVWSRPRKPQPFFGENGHTVPSSISEKVWLNINGRECRRPGSHQPCARVGRLQASSRRGFRS